MWNKGSNWTQKKKSNIYANYERQEKHATVYFTRKLNIPISHNGEMLEFLTFQRKPLFSDFCSRMIFFLSTIMSSLRSEEFSFEFPRVA